MEFLICHPKGGVVFAGSADGTSCMWNLKGECMQVGGDPGALTPG